MVTTLLALQVERARLPERAGEVVVGRFVEDVLEGRVADRRDLVARGKELGIDLDRGAAVVVAAVHPRRPAEGDWQARALTVLSRATRKVVPTALAAFFEERIALIVPGADASLCRRAAEAAAEAIHAAMPGFATSIGISRVAADPLDLARCAGEAVLAANVATPSPDEANAEVLEFEQTGAYRLLLPAMSKDPAELERFYTETIAPLAAYDEQYGTELVGTLATFLANDGSMAASAEQLFTHRHTIRYRLERVRELSGLDVASSDGRERLSLGLKAMRVLGLRPPSAPVFEPGAESGRVPGRPDAH
jgi:DNA-binding PucR family transcriptional regulator